jgi:hypothetical protein
VTDYQLHAQYPPAFDAHDIQIWHIAHAGRPTGLCGRLLAPVAEVRPLSAYLSLPRQGRCERCRSAYRALLTRPTSTAAGSPTGVGPTRTGTAT